MVLSSRTRRCRTARFPFGLFYQVRSDEILIVAVIEQADLLPLIQLVEGLKLAELAFGDALSEFSGADPLVGSGTLGIKHLSEHIVIGRYLNRSLVGGVELSVPSRDIEFHLQRLHVGICRSAIGLQPFAICLKRLSHLLEVLAFLFLLLYRVLGFTALCVVLRFFATSRRVFDVLISSSRTLNRPFASISSR